MESAHKRCLAQAFILAVTMIAHADGQSTTTNRQYIRTTYAYAAPKQHQPISETRIIRRRRHTNRYYKPYRTTRHRRRYRRYGYTYGPVGPYWSYYGWPGTYDYGIYGGVGFGGNFYI